VGDFLEAISRLFLPQQSRDLTSMRPALELLEEQVFQGEIIVEPAMKAAPLILYRAGNLSLPLQHVSSMVGELAPLDLWIKYVLNPDDLLIIDEPEAHLHPEAQRLITRVLVRLVRAGVRVLCTTHSSLILHQASNHLLATDADPKTRAKLGFTEDDLLKDAEVGVYLFKMQKDGTHIKPVPIEPGFGILEDEFVRVAEEIGEQTYRLSLAPRKRSRRRSR
jgi:predicted ATPase